MTSTEKGGYENETMKRDEKRGQRDKKQRDEDKDAANGTSYECAEIEKPKGTETMNRCGNSAGRKRSGKIARNWTVSLASANELLVPRLRSLFPTYEFSPCWLTVDWIG